MNARNVRDRLARLEGRKRFRNWSAILAEVLAELPAEAATLDAWDEENQQRFNEAAQSATPDDTE